ncbi:HCP-like protein [Ceratobasidium sp. AG-Ba]|nr:HCP-like protein [Ceratobasidium sp. AG-Ba]
MAGPRNTRPPPPAFDHNDVYSPLTNLVRKASLNHSSSGGIPTYASLGLNQSTGQTSTDARPPNMRSVSDQTSHSSTHHTGKKGVPPSLVLDRDHAHQSHRRAQPSSPLLHTRFRASVATSIGSASDLDPRDSQEVEYPFNPNHLHRHQPSSGSGSDSNYTPSPTAHRPFAYVVDDTHAVPSPTSQYSAGGPVSPNQPFQFDTRTSVAPSEDVRTPFQYDPRASSVTASTDAPFQYDDRSSRLGLGAATNTRASNASGYNHRGTWRSSNAPDPDPFSFRDYESPRVEPPIVVVHSPMSTIQDTGDEDVDGDQFFLGDAQSRPGSSHSQPEGDHEDVGSTSYHDAYEYVYGAIEADDDQEPISEPQSATSQNFFAPEPTEPVYAAPAPVPASGSAGRVPSVATGGGRYNYSRPMRSGVNGSISSVPSTVPDETPSPAQTSQNPAAGKSPLRKATGPLIFQSSEEDRRSPSPGQAGTSPSSDTRSLPAGPSPKSGQSQHLDPQDPQRPPSLYSQYSFYSLPNSTPPESPLPNQNQQQPQPPLRPKQSGSMLNPNNQPPASIKEKQPSAAQQYLSRGIAAHEQGNLRESARYFERSAIAEGGCGVGMLMWGLSLRHGWGCRKDERAGFKWLRRAAEAAVADLESARSGEEAKAVRNELVLAIYEVGQCFFHGWGVGQDRPMAVSYFQVAARLGDCDAQQELAFCYLNGKGCKKDMKEAAKWYRAAAAQGASTVGLAWIYKPKYA